MAARHLIELGHRRIGLVGGHAHLDVVHNVPTERAAGFTAALEAAGLRLPRQYVEDGDFSIEGGRSAMHALMRRPKPPTAVWLMSDEMCFGALQSLRELGLVAGRDVSVIGFDDHPVSNSVGLTTIRQPVRDIGRLGARLMLDQLEGFGTVMHHPIELSLVERSTCGPPPG
jgi:DNA-binding LacI/PurR family transcriptional regulator